MSLVFTVCSMNTHDASEVAGAEITERLTSNFTVKKEGLCCIMHCIILNFNSW